MRGRNLQLVDGMSRRVITKNERRHRHFVADHVQTSARNQSRENAGVAQISANGGDGGKVQPFRVLLEFKPAPDEVTVVNQTKVSDRNSFRGSRGTRCV